LWQFVAAAALSPAFTGPGLKLKKTRQNRVLTKQRLFFKQCLGRRKRALLLLELIPDAHDFRFKGSDSLPELLDSQKAQILPGERLKRLTAPPSGLQIICIHSSLLLALVASLLASG
jgi:hypothetical protein